VPFKAASVRQGMLTIFSDKSFHLDVVIISLLFLMAARSAPAEKDLTSASKN
jgi:hypothetical protein